MPWTKITGTHSVRELLIGIDTLLESAAAGVKGELTLMVVVDDVAQLKRGTIAAVAAIALMSNNPTT
jgi:hypothetical protein